MGEKKIERYLTIDEVAELLHLSRSAIYQRMAEGYLKAYKPGKKLLFDPEDVRAFVNRFKK